ncbi:MAG: protein phosphatase 1 regulatory subunit 42 [Defluviitaleaceae bacterium]|nr:protein phosphatase 1 regulatory subunit 42 [Defluviitaleaceae bacterium]
MFPFKTIAFLVFIDQGIKIFIALTVGDNVIAIIPDRLFIETYLNTHMQYIPIDNYTNLNRILYIVHMTIIAVFFIILYRFTRYFYNKHEVWDGYIVFIFSALICRITDTIARGGVLDFISLQFRQSYRTTAYIFDFADIYLAIFAIMFAIRIIFMIAETYEKEKINKQSSHGFEECTQQRIPNFANIKKWIQTGLPYKKSDTVQNNRLFIGSAVSTIFICIVITYFIVVDISKENNDNYIRIGGMNVSTSITELILSYDMNIHSNVVIWEPLTNADIEPLKYIPGLRTLYLMGHTINNIDVLAHLTELEELWLTGNDIAEIDVLVNLPKLKILYLGGNQITDISPLKGLKDLEVLVLVNNNITDVSSLMGLINLQDLWLNGNPLAYYQINELKTALPNVNIRFDS